MGNHTASAPALTNSFLSRAEAGPCSLLCKGSCFNHLQEEDEHKERLQAFQIRSAFAFAGRLNPVQEKEAHNRGRLRTHSKGVRPKRISCSAVPVD